MTSEIASHNRNNVSFLQDRVSIPKEMTDALESDDPVQALKLLAQASKQQAIELGNNLQTKLDSFDYQLPSILTQISVDHPIHTAVACSDSIYNSLSRIASGGSQASREIRSLEDSKRQVEQHMEAVSMALELRKCSDVASRALQAESWLAAAEAIRPWLEWNKTGSSRGKTNGTEHDETANETNQQHEQLQDPRTREYAGDYALQQLQVTHEQLATQVLQLYKAAVEQGDLKMIGQLTPVLSLIQLDEQALSLYLQFLTSNVLEPAMQQAVAAVEGGDMKQQQQQAPYAPMARVYNASVNTLRHHLPLVSHCLHKVDGDAAVVRLVHSQVEQAVLPLLRAYQANRQLKTTSLKATKVYAALEERYTGRGSSGGLLDDATAANENADDCGFSVVIGTLSDVDAAMEEAAICIQHSESYLRFLHHTCHEINKARHLRWEREQQATRWTANDKKEEYLATEIVSPMTQLHQTVAEVGGQYAAIEHCLLLASMQRAFVQPETDPRYYQPLSLLTDGTNASIHNEALQTALVDTCLYALRHGMQRALATGHTGTASAMTNFCVDCLNDILLEVLSHRAEEMGVNLLKPGEGLLVGSAGIFNASNLIRQGTTVAGAQQKDLLVRKQQQQEGIARACATLNDLEVAVQRTEQLESILMTTVDKGFSSDQHTEQLRMCVRSLQTVSDGFKVAADASIESLESVLKSRIRSIVGEAVGAEGGVGTFMGSMGAGKATDRITARMNYNLDDDMYNLMQLSEGYMVHLCSLLDELLMPLRSYLAPRLWDNLLLTVLATVSKRLETSLRKCDFSSLGALALDTDMRDLLSYTKDKLYGPEYQSTTAVTKGCPSLSRLLQIAKLLNVDDLDDVLDLISSLKRKNNWDVKLEDAKAFLSARVEFDAAKVNELLRIPEDS
ncbi:hypothetical protein MPSEU_000660800 [Mayamaea pseudoterrestris]|nr:hypothetical protein MPSEU_000660800 [Mayamaea pseudoterrestris]